MELINGPWFDPVMTHYIGDNDPTDPVYRSAIRTEIHEILLTVVFSGPPTVPTSNKWVQLAECLDWFFKVTVICGLLEPLFLKAFKPVSATIVQKACRAARASGHIEEISHLNWHASAGKRIATGMALVTDQEAQSQLIVLLVLSEAL